MERFSYTTIRIKFFTQGIVFSDKQALVSVAASLNKASNVESNLIGSMREFHPFLKMFRRHITHFL